VQTGVEQPRSAAGQQRAIGGQGDVVHARGRGDLRDEQLEVGAQQWLAARQAHLVDAELDEDLDQQGDLSDGQDLVLWQEDVVGAEQLARHAVRAAEVAAVGHGDAQIAQMPTPGIADIADSCVDHAPTVASAATRPDGPL
jgi:hypothetical protein